MSSYLTQISILLKRLSIILVLYIVSRILFISFNTHLFHIDDFNSYVKILFYGLRFDLSAIFATNSLFIFASLLPSKVFYKKRYQHFLAYTYIPINILALIANLSDIIYVRFTLKRTTWDFLNMFREDTKMLSLLPKFITDFWYITVITLLFSTIIVIVFYKSYKEYKYKSHSYLYIVESFTFLFSVALSVLIVRGGFQLRPIGIITAGNYVSVNMTPAILNTPFTLMKSVGKQNLRNVNYFTSGDIKKYYNPVHTPDSTFEFTPLNVVVIIMESLSKEHIGALNRDVKDYLGFTPFLDSLIPHSLVCIHAYANGKTSIKGIPSVVASLPTLMDNSFVSSIYSSNRITSLASVLKTQGYSTSFFHGGHNGTMGFDQFVNLADFDSYYGRKEYNNDADYDGKWGIFDEPFFQFFAKKLSTFKQPFFSSIFSLSAHHPYTIPKQYTGKFRRGKIAIQECIMYSDYALKRFFDTAKKQDWYNNTLFVITADHCSETAMKKYNTDAGRYAIPIIYYMPSDSTLRGEYEQTTQQIDILPSVLDYLHYNKKYFSFGQSIFHDKEFGFSVSYLNYNYQFISGNAVAKTGTKNNEVVFRKITDYTGTDTVLSSDRNRYTNFIHAFIQTYNSSMNNNTMYCK